MSFVADSSKLDKGPYLTSWLVPLLIDTATGAIPTCWLFRASSVSSKDEFGSTSSPDHERSWSAQEFENFMGKAAPMSKNMRPWFPYCQPKHLATFGLEKISLALHAFRACSAITIVVCNDPFHKTEMRQENKVAKSDLLTSFREPEVNLARYSLHRVFLSRIQLSGYTDLSS